MRCSGQVDPASVVCGSSPDARYVTGSMLVLDGGHTVI
jgi:hypothetical protein